MYLTRGTSLKKDFSLLKSALTLKMANLILNWFLKVTLVESEQCSMRFRSSNVLHELLCPTQKILLQNSQSRRLSIVLKSVVSFI